MTKQDLAEEKAELLRDTTRYKRVERQTSLLAEDLLEEFAYVLRSQAGKLHDSNESQRMLWMRAMTKPVASRRHNLVAMLKINIKTHKPDEGSEKQRNPCIDTITI